MVSVIKIGLKRCNKASMRVSPPALMHSEYIISNPVLLPFLRLWIAYLISSYEYRGNRVFTGIIYRWRYRVIPIELFIKFIIVFKNVIFTCWNGTISLLDTPTYVSRFSFSVLYSICCEGEGCLAIQYLFPLVLVCHPSQAFLTLLYRPFDN